MDNAVSLDQIFSTALLKLVVPDTTLDFPPTVPTDEWLEAARSVSVERKQAFFDEHLQSLLLVYIKNPDAQPPADPSKPPEVLLDLLAHIQVSIEASYISQTATTNPETPRNSRMLLTPRTSSLAKPNQRLNPHPSILPPSTPHPMPATGDQDRKYSTAEGTLLVANIWGSNTADNSPEGFCLLWSDEQQKWVAVYKMDITVSFLRLNFSNPLLCLTISATLREKPIPTHPTHPLARFFESLGDFKPERTDSPKSPGVNGQAGEGEHQLLDGLEEVNLLEGLLAAPTFSKDDIYLPSLRLGTVSRQKLFSLPPVLINSPIQPSPSPMTAVRKAHPTLRKSFRKTLQTVSGFRVRMRTVFVPYVLLPETEGMLDDLTEEEKELERREAGSEERTVVLCVEIENSGDLGMTAGFMVEKVDVSIGGEGAQATLIGWGEDGFTSNAAKNTFPLRIGPLAQYNLLYAVTFMRSPEEIDAFSFAHGVNDTRAAPDLQRAVTINIYGKPYFPPPPSSTSLSIPHSKTLAYPTQTFSSRWNCVLDLASQPARPHDTFEAGDPSADYPSIMPEPASPFPGGLSVYSSNMTPGMQMGSATPQYSATAGSRRFTLVPGANFAGRTLKTLTPNRSLRPGDIGRETSPVPSSRLSAYALSAAGSAQYMKSPTTYSAPPPPPPIPSTSVQPLVGLPQPPDSPDPLSGLDMPTTPAYPAYPTKSALPSTPLSQRPVSTPTHAGLSVEIRRERGVGAEYGLGALPQTPLPFVSGAFGEQTMLAKLQQAGASGENVIVSVGLLPPSALTARDGGAAEMAGLGLGKIYPLDVFTLDIFVFNQSLWPRRFEVTCPERRRRRRGGEETGVYDGGSEAARKMGYPGVLPLQSRIRIGPLRPSACQSVRMEFLAVSPGVHAIDTLTLTDVETGFSTNLRSVLDIVVHDPMD
ncbi:TRAPP trafficking subunit Trs65-domain-containing protein [Pholiota molesta]|nr:TRAPP trafficking subunit Trs65-domain-containing protein [Pholiota molesta]